jgi:hypothetical protein
MIGRTITLIFLICSAQLANSSQSDVVVLGVLEDLPGHSAGDPNFRGARIVLQKKRNDWQAFEESNYPEEVTWIIGFDDRSLGKVAGGTQKEFLYSSEVGLQDITSGSSVPTIGQRSLDGSGFLSSPVFRPLVANAQPYFADPDKWKPFQPSPELTAALRGQFRKKFPEVSNCVSPEENALKKWLYRDEDIKVWKAYSSNKKRRLFQLRVEKYNCDGPADDPFADQWYVVNPTGELRFLDQEMWLVDAGDCDNDAKSELSFSIDRYNRGGYELF